VNRSVFQLALAQAVMMSVNTLMISSAAIIGSQLAPNKALATLPLAFYFVAVMLTTIPASMLMGVVGRKPGFLLATLIGLAGGVCGVLGVYGESFALFCLGSMGVGIYTGFGNFFRFAAIEASSGENRNTALGYVLAGGVLAAFIGPSLANYGRELFEITYLGTLGAVIVLYGLNGFNFLLMDLPKPAVQRYRAGARPMLRLVGRPGFIVAMASAAIGYSIMVLLMTSSPLEMTHQNHAFSEVAFAIQWHVLGMFAPSFVTGHLVNRFGSQLVIICGACLMVVCILLNFSGSTVTHFWTALLTLGIGWNFMFIGATSMLTENYGPAESARAQAINDFVVAGNWSISR
jgi:MFS family permease